MNRALSQMIDRYGIEAVQGLARFAAAVVAREAEQDKVINDLAAALDRWIDKNEDATLKDLAIRLGQLKVSDIRRTLRGY